MKDARYQFIIEAHPTPPQADPAGAVMVAADMLADMGSKLTREEAALILSEIVLTWGISIDGEVMSRASEWCVGLTASRASGEAQDELSGHLKDQAAGRYSMVSWPWPILTRESRSLMPGSVTIVCGTPGASKSWFALSCIRHWITAGVPAAVLMLEETRKWHLQRGLAQCAGDPRLLYPEWIKENYTKAEALWRQHQDELAVIGSHLTCDGDVTMAACAEYVEKQCDVGKRVIIIDPISLADSGSDDPWKADKRFMARAKVAIEKAGTSLILVTHPRKAGGGKASGPPSLDDLAGGAAYGRACASALWVAGIDRPETLSVINEYGEYRQATPRKLIRIMKARNSTGCGKTIGYAFDDLRFDELGEIAGRAAPEESVKPRNYSKKPDPSEDQFA